MDNQELDILDDIKKNIHEIITLRTENLTKSNIALAHRVGQLETYIKDMNHSNSTKFTYLKKRIKALEDKALMTKKEILDDFGYIPDYCDQ